MNAQKLPTGTPLDELLGGGVERGIVTEVYGPAGAGKTNFCIHFSLACAKSGGKVAYIDTESGLSAERVRQIAPSAKIMKNILVKRVGDFWQQEDTIKALEKREGLSGIVVDSIVMLYRLALTDKTAQDVNRSLAGQVHSLSLLAESRKIPVLITNQVYTPFGEKGEWAPVAGDILRYWPKTILSIEPTGTGTRQATIVKHRSIAEGESCDFSITAKGLV